MRGVRVATMLLALVAASACRAPLSGDDLLMCNAAQLLTTSIVITDESLAAVPELRPEQAVERSVQALGLAEGAARALHEVGEETQAKPLWQGLIRAYKHAADAASSMHPNLWELRNTGPESLSAAREALDGTRTSPAVDMFRHGGELIAQPAPARRRPGAVPGRRMERGGNGRLRVDNGPGTVRAPPDRRGPERPDDGRVQRREIW